MNITCKVEDAGVLPTCLRIMQNSMAKSFSFICRAKSQKALIALCEKVYLDGYAALPVNQSRSYALSTFKYPFECAYGVDFNVTYMYSEKETKELRCAAAKIAEKLLASLPKRHRSLDCVNAVWKHIKKNYKYRMTGDFRDHSAYSLLSRKDGVCQAFAALTSLILPFMGVPCLYISGEGAGKDCWVPHGWSCVRLEDGKWYHLDITYSLDSPVLHTTATALGRMAFEKCHRYDTERFSSEALEETYKNIIAATRTEVTLGSNDTRFFIHGCTCNLQDGEPMLMYIRGKYGVDLSELYFLLGGATVYDGSSDTLMVCLYDSFRYVKNASKYMLGDGYFDVRILKEIDASFSANGSKLSVSLAK